MDKETINEVEREKEALVLNRRNTLRKYREAVAVGYFLAVSKLRRERGVFMPPNLPKP